MDKELWEQLVRAYGTRIEKHKDVLHWRIAATIAATCYAGKEGDNPLSVLNRALDNAIRLLTQ
jgi:cytochrome b